MGKIGVLFSGQGAQTPGMMQDLYECIDVGRQVFETADRTLGRCISGLAFGGTQEELNLTHNTQPCVLAADLAAYMALADRKIHPDAAAGFSLGEYAALAAAGSLTIEQAFSVIQKRADYMQEAVPEGKGAMAAIGGRTEEEVRLLCEAANGYVIPANLNCPGQIVVSGESKAVNQVVEMARERKLKAMVLPVSAPFHCEMLKPAADRLAVELEKIPFGKPKIPVYMNVDGKKETDGTGICRKLVSQATSPVYWEKTIRNMYADGIDIFIEAGPGKTLSGFTKKIFKGWAEVTSLRVSDMPTLQDTVHFLEENGYGGNRRD